MKIYTKTGDDGLTGLFGGQRVSKSHARIECYGTVDELNAAIGWAAVAADTDLRTMLETIQNELFVIGSHLATPPEIPQTRKSTLPALDPAMVARLEQQIDAADAILPSLKNFILPGGSEVAARLHVARTICRRAERQIVAIAQSVPVEGIIVTYVNRLSDWLFIQARMANHRAGVADVAWIKQS